MASIKCRFAVVGSTLCGPKSHAQKKKSSADVNVAKKMFDAISISQECRKFDQKYQKRNSSAEFLLNLILIFNSFLLVDYICL